MTEKPLREKTISELGFIGKKGGTWGKTPKTHDIERLKDWVKAIIKDCCPKKTPDTLGAAPTRCEACERLMWMFEIDEGELDDRP